jgi:hypothetical protein
LKYLLRNKPSERIVNFSMAQRKQRVSSAAAAAAVTAAASYLFVMATNQLQLKRVSRAQG